MLFLGLSAELVPFGILALGQSELRFKLPLLLSSRIFPGDGPAIGSKFEPIGRCSMATRAGL